jgi:DNA-directed RNA polymerase specialized sigma subunit
MPDLILTLSLLFLFVINKMQERQIKKVNRMLKQAEKRERDIRELANKTNLTSTDVFSAAKKFVWANTQMLGQLEAAYRALDALTSDRDNLKSQFAILQRRNDGTDREA